MKPPSLTTIIIVVVSTCCSLAVAASDPPTSPPTTSATAPAAETGQSFGEQLEDALGITRSNSDILPLLADAVSKRKGDATTYGRAIDKLVDGLLAGPAPSALIDKALPLVEVGSTKAVSPYDEPTWKWGSPSARRALEDTIWKLAQAAHEKDPKRSSELARASLMLAALSDIEDGWESLARVVNDPDTARKLLDVSEARFKVLSDIIRTRIEQDHVDFNEGLAALQAMDAIDSKKSGTVTMGEVSDILTHLDNKFKKGVPQLFDQCGTVYYAWILLNILHDKGDAQSIAAVGAQLRKWKADDADPNLGKWIDEALSRRGTPPGRLVGNFEVVPGTKQLKPIAPNDPRLSPQSTTTRP